MNEWQQKFRCILLGMIHILKNLVYFRVIPSGPLLFYWLTIEQGMAPTMAVTCGCRPKGRTSGGRLLTANLHQTQCRVGFELPLFRIKL